jgi:hypothetical protein
VSQAPDTSILKDGARLASPLGAAGDGPGRFNVMAEATPANLQRLAELLDDAARSEFRSSAGTRSSRRAKHSRRCLPRTRRASSA